MAWDDGSILETDMRYGFACRWLLTCLWVLLFGAAAAGQEREGDVSATASTQSSTWKFPRVVGSEPVRVKRDIVAKTVWKRGREQKVLLVANQHRLSGRPATLVQSLEVDGQLHATGELHAQISAYGALSLPGAIKAPGTYVRWDAEGIAEVGVSLAQVTEEKAFLAEPVISRCTVILYDGSVQHLALDGHSIRTTRGFGSGVVVEGPGGDREFLQLGFLPEDGSRLNTLGVYLWHQGATRFLPLVGPNHRRLRLPATLISYCTGHLAVCVDQEGTPTVFGVISDGDATYTFHWKSTAIPKEVSASRLPDGFGGTCRLEWVPTFGRVDSLFGMESILTCQPWVPASTEALQVLTVSLERPEESRVNALRVNEAAFERGGPTDLFGLVCVTKEDQVVWVGTDRYLGLEFRVGSARLGIGSTGLGDVFHQGAAKGFLDGIGQAALRVGEDLRVLVGPSRMNVLGRETPAPREGGLTLLFLRRHPAGENHSGGEWGPMQVQAFDPSEVFPKRCLMIAWD